MFKKKFRAIAISVIILATLAIGAGTAWAIDETPQIPDDYSGTVYVGGVQAGAGLVVTDSIGNWRTPEGEGSVTDASGAYWYLAGPNSSEYLGSIIHFYVNGVQANETDTFTTVNPGGSIKGFDLHIAALPTPTPTPTMTPTPTAIPISSNGNGIIGTSGGTVNTSDGTITITFPGGAFNASTNVSIQGGTCHTGTSGFAVGGTCFNVTPDGALSANATICVNLSVADLIIVDKKSDLKLGYWANSSWNLADNISINGTIICGQTNHLSDWAVLGATVNSTPAATPTPSTTPTSAATSTPSTTPTSTTSPTPTPTHTPSQTNGGGTNWALIGGIAGGVLLLAVIIIAMNSRRRGGGKSSRPRRSSRKAKPKK